MCPAVSKNENRIVREIAIGEIVVFGRDMGCGKGDNVSALGLP